MIFTHSMIDTPSPPEAVAIGLAAEVLRRFGELRFVARGSSMLPSIYPGDLLTVRAHSLHEARTGQIVLCLREGRFWAHRVIRKCRDGNRTLLATRGDALPNEDPLLEETQLLGRVTSIHRYGQPVKVAHVEGLWLRLARLGVRNSNAVAKILLRRHSLRMRLLGRTNALLGQAPGPVLECL
jgi:signal peptidase I